MSDPRTFEDDTTSFDECDVCEHVNRVTYWESTLTHRWSRDAFDCINCDTHHSEIHGDDLDRGASDVVFTIRMGAYAFILIGVVAWDHWTVPLTVTGLAVLTAIRLITAFVNANRMVKEAPHE